MVLTGGPNKEHQGTQPNREKLTELKRLLGGIKEIKLPAEPARKEFLGGRRHKSIQKKTAVKIKVRGDI